MEEMLAESKEEHISDDQDKRDAKTIHNNNNHHVVSIGVLIVLCTIYLMFAGLQTNYNFYFKPLVAANQLNVDTPEPTKSHLNIQQPNLCRQIEVFTKDNNGQPKTSNSLVLKRKSLRSTKLSENRRSRTKKKDIAKKSNTAEPIIYLFALVFIYLLLKAASDINQHYKTNKGDKRLRRCSLQSYAQKEQRSGPHLDRRASKGISTKSLPKF